MAKPRSDRPFSRGTVSSLKCGAVVFSVASEERKVPIDTRHQTANLPSSTILPQTAKPHPHFFKHCVFETSRNDNVRCSTLVRNAFETSLQSLITATACSVPPPIMAIALTTEFKPRNQSPSPLQSLLVRQTPRTSRSAIFLVTDLTKGSNLLMSGKTFSERDPARGRAQAGWRQAPVT